MVNKEGVMDERTKKEEENQIKLDKEGCGKIRKKGELHESGGRRRVNVIGGRRKVNKTGRRRLNES